jgi:predicted CoA-binding protein
MIEATEREHLRRIYAETRTIAVVGASADESKAAHQIPRYLQRNNASWQIAHPSSRCIAMLSCAAVPSTSAPNWAGELLLSYCRRA